MSQHQQQQPMRYQQQQSHPQQQGQQQWSPDQRRQQIAELLRNKGVICRDYLYTSRCPRTPTCPYMHVMNGETRPVPWSVCTFFTQGKCLRDRCTFFHGTQAQLEELHATGSPLYRPQDYMKITVPPSEYLNPDGSIATGLDFAAVPPHQPAAPVHVMSGPAIRQDNAVNTFHPLVLMQQTPQSIASSMFSGQGNTPNTSSTQFPFYSNSPMATQMPMQTATTVFQPTLQSMPTSTYYQNTNAHMLASPAQQHHHQQYASAAQYNASQQQQQRNLHQQQQQIGSQVYFQIQPQQ